MDPSHLTGLVLAGGESRRFGADKALHRLDGRTLVEHVGAALAAVTTEVLVSVRAPGQALPEGLAARPVADRFPGAGPLAGLEAGLAAARTPWVLVVACDLPFAGPDALGRLVAAAGAPWQAVVARGADGRLQPLCAVYATALQPLAEARLRAGHRSMFGLLDALEHVRGVHLPDAALRNLNRPTDLPAGG